MACLRPALLAAAVGAAIMLAGCAPGPMIDRLPDSMGLPAGAPARPAEPYQYPAVHDMPPPRATQPMTEAEQRQVEKDLTTLRNRQAARAGVEAPAKTAPPAKDRAAKKKPADVIVVPPAGAAADP